MTLGHHRPVFKAKEVAKRKIVGIVLCQPDGHDIHVEVVFLQVFQQRKTFQIAGLVRIRRRQCELEVRGSADASRSFWLPEAEE